MTIPFFNSILSALGRKVNYDAVVNYAGNSFAKDSWQLIQDANPMRKERTMSRGLQNMFASAMNVMTQQQLVNSQKQNPDDDMMAWVMSQ